MQESSYTPSGTSILVPPGISLRPVVRGRVFVGSEDIGALGDRDEALVTFRLEYSEATGRFEVAAFGIDRGDLPLEVSGAFFRTVRVNAIAKIGILAALPAWARDLAQLRHLHDRGGLRSFPEFSPSDDEAMLLTGLIYRIAEISDENPAQAVAESIGLKQRTATNWILRARGVGYMTSTDHGAAARRLAKSIEPLWSTHTTETLDELFTRLNMTDDDVRALVARENAKLDDAAGGERSHGDD